MQRRCQTRVQPRWRQPTGRKKRWRRMKHGRTVLGWETRQWMDEGHGVRAIDRSARAQTFSPCRCASATDDAGLRQARSPRRSGARRRRVGEKTGALASWAVAARQRHVGRAPTELPCCRRAACPSRGRGRSSGWRHGTRVPTISLCPPRCRGGLDHGVLLQCYCYDSDERKKKIALIEGEWCPVAAQAVRG